MIDNIINNVVVEALAALQQVLIQFDIDLYLVGAVARDIHLSSNPAWTPKRKTNDVDIAVMIADEGQFYDIKNVLIQKGNFTAHGYEFPCFHFLFHRKASNQF
jgi:predicted nucleotidyltransferase